MKLILGSLKSGLLCVLILISGISQAYSGSLKDDLLYIRFSESMGALYTLRARAEEFFADRGELLTSPAQPRIKFEGLYYSNSISKHGERIDSLERVVIEKDGRLKVYLTKDFGDGAYYGFRPKFVFKKDVYFGINETRKHLEWDCVTNLPAGITKNMSGCVVDTPVSQEEILAAALQD